MSLVCFVTQVLSTLAPTGNPGGGAPHDSWSGQSSEKDWLLGLAGGVFEHDIGHHSGIGFIWHVGAEADADVKGAIEMQVDGWAEWVHGLTFQAHEECE